MSFRDLFRRGVPTHVALHARLERKNAETSRDVKQELRKAGFKKELIVANVRGCAKLVRRLDWEPGKTEWNQYGFTTSYTDEDATRKEAFVREVVHEPPVEARLGHRLQPRQPRADRGRELRLRVASTATPPSSTASTARSRTRARRRSCRSSAT